MHRMDHATDVAAEVTSQAVTSAPGWIPIGLSALAILIALFSAWVNIKTVAPRISVKLLAEDQAWGQTYFQFRIINEGKTLVEDVSLKWDYDPTHLWFNPEEWKQDVLMPGEHFTARMAIPAVGPIEYDQPGLASSRVDWYNELIVRTPKRRRLGVATYKRHIRIPFVQTRQRISLPMIPDDFHAALSSHFREQREQQERA